MKRRLFLSALAICLIAVMAYGSLAYFTDSQSVTNKFRVASSDDPDAPDDPDKIFSVEVSEKTPGGQTTTEGNLYTDITPGQKIDKEPVIKNTGDFDQWIRVTVTINNAANWLKLKDASGNNYTAANLFDKLIGDDATSGFNKSIWTEVKPDAVTKDDTLVYKFYLKDAEYTGTGVDEKGKLVKDETVSLFKKVTIPSHFTQADMKLAFAFDLTVKADAVQADNTGNNSKATFESTSPKYWDAD